MPRSSVGVHPTVSLFELVYGRTVQGSLELLREEWCREDSKGTNVCRWVKELGERLEELDTMRETIAVVKERQKHHYDKVAKLRCFKVGEIVLTSIPGEDASDGSFEVNRKLSNVNYKICIPG